MVYIGSHTLFSSKSLDWTFRQESEGCDEYTPLTVWDSSTDLCVGPPNLDNVSKLFALFSESSEQRGEAGEESTVDLSGHSHMHRSGKCVIGALATVHVVVWVDWVFGAQLSSQYLNGPAITT